MKEDINNVELRGRIGGVRVDDRLGIASFTIATNRVYKNRDGQAVIETAWHSVRMFGKPEDFAGLEKGRTAHVEGLIRYPRYTAEDGTERVTAEIVARKCEVEEEI